MIPVLANSVDKSLYDGCSKISNFQATLNALISHINFSMYNILVFLRTYFHMYHQLLIILFWVDFNLSL